MGVEAGAGDGIEIEGAWTGNVKGRGAVLALGADMPESCTGRRGGRFPPQALGVLRLARYNLMFQSGLGREVRIMRLVEEILDVGGSF